MVIPASGNSNDNDGTRLSGDISNLYPEQLRPVYYESSNTGAMSGGISAAGSKCVMIVVVSEWSIPRPRRGDYGGVGNEVGEGGRCGDGGGGEEGGGVVRGDTIWVNRADRVTQKLSSIWMEPSVLIASDMGRNTTT